MSSTRTILLILGFLSTLAVIALIAVAVTQNQPLPKNIKVLRSGPLRGEGGLVPTVLTDMSLPLLALANLFFCLHAHQHLVLHLCGKTNDSFTGNHLLSNQSQFGWEEQWRPFHSWQTDGLCVCLVPRVWGQHTGSGLVPQVWHGFCFARSMGSCWTRDHPTPTSTCTSGQQRRRTTLGWWSRWRCVKLKVRGEKGAGEGAWDEEETM